MHDAIGAAADHSFVQRRMTCRANHKQVRVEISGKLDDVPHRMSRDDVGIEFYALFFGHGARAR